VNAASVETKIYSWFQRRYPDGPQWTSRDFGCFRDAPLELRMIVSMDKVEGEIENGGLPQLLWNVFYHWRHVLDDCETGYGRIGAVPQRDATCRVRLLFEKYELECRGYIDNCVREQNFDFFNKWCDYGYTVMDSGDEALFSLESDIRTRRAEWLASNEAKLAHLMSLPR